jgi:hypothetical protein
MLDIDGTIPPQLVLVERLVYVDGVQQSVAGPAVKHAGPI